MTTQGGPGRRLATPETAPGGHPDGADLRYWQILAGLLGASFASLVAFLWWPALDLAPVARFAAPDGTFPIAADPLSLAARDLFRTVFYVACGFVLAMLLRALALGPGGVAVPVRLWAFAGTALALGPGIIANALLKTASGRARPDRIEAFGGPEAFTLPFVRGEACVRNCGFVSGEASAMGMVAILIGVLAWRSCTRVQRVLLVVALAVPTAYAGFLRVAMGRHFPSDVIFAWLIAALVVAALYPLFGVGRLRHRFTVEALRQDVGAGADALARRLRAVRARP